MLKKKILSVSDKTSIRRTRVQPRLEEKIIQRTMHSVHPSSDQVIKNPNAIGYVSSHNRHLTAPIIKLASVRSCRKFLSASTLYTHTFRTSMCSLPLPLHISFSLLSPFITIGRKRVRRPFGFQILGRSLTR